MSGSGGGSFVMMKTRLWAKMIGCFRMNPRENRGGKNALLCCFLS